ncbi:MAG: hypothetical protein IKZ92_07290 [Muribaculaceae bacterium]|nr:hypothetical protein [Muribaculaceae bacterium]
MLKRHILLFVLIVMSVAVSDATTWIRHNYYVSSSIQNIFDTGDKVYYLNSNMLYRFDKATSTTAALFQQNILSDNYIDQIYYDYERNLLFVAYADANIDVIDGEGAVTNISSVKDAIVRVYNVKFDENSNLSSYTEKRINDITFSNGMAYVAIGYGYVAIDESTMRVVKEKVLSETINVNSVTMLGDLLLILSNTYCYYGSPDADDPIKQFAKFKSPSSSFTGGRLFPIDDHSTFVVGASALYRCDFSTSPVGITTLASVKLGFVQKSLNGYIANFSDQQFYYTIDEAGLVATQVANEGGFASCNPSGDGTVWISDANGLHIDNSTEYYKLTAMTTNQPYWLKYNTAMDLLYVGVSARNGNTLLSGALPANVINTFDGTTWSDATAYKALGAGYEFVFNPLDSTTYMRASWDRGIHKVTNNVMKLNYTYANSLIGKYKAHPAFDIYGNMWVVSSYQHADYPTVPTAVLPKEYVAKNSVSKARWFEPSGLTALNTNHMQRSRFLVSKLNNIKIYSDCDYLSTGMAGRIMCWDNFNEDPTLDTYQFTSIGSFMDQANKMVTWSNISHMEEDVEGLIWVGYESGVFFFDPNIVFSEVPMATRPIVTNQTEEKGSYLCEGNIVYDIGVDRNNNKWLATNEGVYHVSPDGSQIIAHYTTSNSDIPSDIVYSVECDTKHNRVYIYTENGFAEYFAEADAPALDFNSVYAYPNPVEPDFTGMVKIANLMADTYVTITDHNGQVVAQLGPVMGGALWDGSGADGSRVDTGLYNIYVSQGGQPVTTGAPQATIMIIK